MPALKPQQFVETYIGGVEKVDRDLHKWSICEIQTGSHFLHPADKNGEGKVILKIQKSNFSYFCYCEEEFFVTLAWVDELE